MIEAASYLANKPVGWPFAMLIISATLLAVATVLAGWSRNAFQAAIAAAVFCIVIAYLA